MSRLEATSAIDATGAARRRLDDVREALARYAFVAANEADLQRQVADVLQRAGMPVEREVLRRAPESPC